jgi:hypothetical protein
MRLLELGRPRLLAGARPLFFSELKSRGSHRLITAALSALSLAYSTNDCLSTFVHMNVFDSGKRRLAP